MAIQEQLYTVDDVWRLSQLPENELKHFYLIDGELFWDMPPGFLHGHIAGLIFHYFLLFAEQHDLGKPTVESGYYPANDRTTLLAPDVAFVRKENVPLTNPTQFVPHMPNLAVEIASPSNTVAELRRKAAVYLANGTELVWLVMLEQASAEMWRMGPDGQPATEFVGQEGALTGDPVLPGFTLPVDRLFPR
jgi:Uma2 family endonuclease